MSLFVTGHPNTLTECDFQLPNGGVKSSVREHVCLLSCSVMSDSLQPM